MPTPLKPGEVTHASVPTVTRKNGTFRYLTRYKDERGNWTSMSFEAKAPADELATLIRQYGRDAAFRVFLARLDGETTLVEALKPLVVNRRPSDLLFTKKNGKVIRQQYFWEWVWVPARNLVNGLPAFPYRGKKADGTYKARRRSDWDPTPASPGETLNKEIRVHDLRHTFASWMLNAGVPFDVQQDAMGHESVKTTVDRYGHILRGRREQTAKVGAELWRAMEKR